MSMPLLVIGEWLFANKRTGTMCAAREVAARSGATTEDVRINDRHFRERRILSIEICVSEIARALKESGREDGERKWNGSRFQLQIFCCGQGVDALRSCPLSASRATCFFEDRLGR
jgi:hypothetical protein